MSDNKTIAVAMATAFGVGALLAVFILKQREARKSTTHKQATDEKNEKKQLKTCPPGCIPSKKMKTILFLGPKTGAYNHLIDQGHNIDQTEQILDANLLSSDMYDLVVSHKYRHIVRSNIIQLFDSRIINLHASYLPFNRGADPNLWSHLEKTPGGISIHHLTKGLDTGNIIFREKLHFNPNKTLKQSYDDLENLMVKSFEKVFQEFQCNNRFKSGRPQCELNKGKFTLHFSKEKDSFIHDWKKGWETSIEEAQTLYAQFLYNEGSAYFYGLGKCVINHEKSREAWVRASNLGHNAARGRCHFFGYSPYSKDSIKTIECWTDAMNEGDPEGHFLLGFAYSTGYGVMQDCDKGYALYESAAHKGVGPALNNCARVNEKKEMFSTSWDQYNIAAEKYYVASAQYRIGLALFHGELNQKKNPEKGIYWIKMSASQGHESAKEWYENYSGEITDASSFFDRDRVEKDK